MDSATMMTATTAAVELRPQFELRLRLRLQLHEVQDAYRANANLMLLMTVASAPAVGCDRVSSFLTVFSRDEGAPR